MIRTSLHFIRIARAGWVLAREGVFSQLDPSLVPPGLSLPLTLARLISRNKAQSGASRLPIAIDRLGPSYVKLGQFLATRPDLIGLEAARALEVLQDRMAPFSKEEAIRTIETAFGQRLDQIFDEFSEPIAAASIAQVHKATIRNGAENKNVAVKILRPGVERRFNRDLADMLFAAQFAERNFVEARRLKLIEVVETLSRSVKMEMDFRLEAAAASEFLENTQDDPHFRVPKIDWDRTAKSVLTLEWIDGTPLSDLSALRDRQIDLPALGSLVIQSFLRHAVRDGFFHADMHQGNLFLDLQGNLVAVDFGITGRLGMKERKFLAKILYGFITRDYHLVASVHFEAGYVPPHHNIDDFAQAIRAIGEPIHSRTADQISMAKLLTLLFEITSLFDMKTRTELILLQKTMVVVEGVARSLNPQLDMWSTAEPVVRSWIEKNLGPVGKLQEAGQTISALGLMFMDLPDLVHRGQKAMAQLEARLNSGSEQGGGSIPSSLKDQRSGFLVLQFSLWIIAALLAILIVMR